MPLTDEDFALYTSEVEGPKHPTLVEEKSLTPEEFSATFNIRYLNHLEFQKPEYLLKCAKRCEKNLRKKISKRWNHWSHALHANCLYRDVSHLVKIKWIHPMIGYGVFAAQDIPEYTFIGEYTGTIRKRSRRRDRINNYIFGYLAGSRGTPYVIDAEKQGNFTRFLNHSDEPNLASKWIIERGVTHIFFMANKLIKKGCQLTYDYGKYYWRHRSTPELL